MRAQNVNDDQKLYLKLWNSKYKKLSQIKEL